MQANKTGVNESGLWNLILKKQKSALSVSTKCNKQYNKWLLYTIATGSIYQTQKLSNYGNVFDKDTQKLLQLHK